MHNMPKTAAGALARWDRCEPVRTASMGGLGPDYEQVIHIIAFEFIRELLKHKPIDWSLADAAQLLSRAEQQKSAWVVFNNAIEKAVQPRTAHLHSSGAQWGATQNLAYIVVRKGWAQVLSELPAERLIRVVNKTAK